MAMNSDFVCNK